MKNNYPSEVYLYYDNSEKAPFIFEAKTPIYDPTGHRIKMYFEETMEDLCKTTFEVFNIIDNLPLIIHFKKDDLDGIVGKEFNREQRIEFVKKFKETISK